MKYDFITIGGAAEDITFLVEDGVAINNKKDVLRQRLLAFEDGAKIEIDNIYYNFGGGSANAAVALSRLGFNVGTIATIGLDERGIRIVKNYKKQGVSTSFIQKVKEDETSYSFILVGKSKERIIFFNRGAEKYLNIQLSDVKDLEKSKWVYMTSLSGDWQRNLERIFSARSVRFAWNPGNEQLESGRIGKFLKKTDLLIINKDEAIQLALAELKKKISKTILNNPQKLLSLIKGLGPKIVVITDGRNGAWAFDGNDFYSQPIIKEKAKADTTGLGDSFASSFLAGLEIYKGNIKKSMWLGAKNASSVITQIGAQNGLLSREQLFGDL